MRAQAARAPPRAPQGLSAAQTAPLLTRLRAGARRTHAHARALSLAQPQPYLALYLALCLALYLALYLARPLARTHSQPQPPPYPHVRTRMHLRPAHAHIRIRHLRGCPPAYLAQNIILIVEFNGRPDEPLETIRDISVFGSGVRRALHHGNLWLSLGVAILLVSVALTTLHLLQCAKPRRLTSCASRALHTPPLHPVPHVTCPTAYVPHPTLRAQIRQARGHCQPRTAARVR